MNVYNLFLFKHLEMNIGKSIYTLHMHNTVIFFNIYFTTNCKNLGTNIYKY